MLKQISNKNNEISRFARKSLTVAHNREQASELLQIFQFIEFLEENLPIFPNWGIFHYLYSV